jgi:hypothetical protein
LGVEAWSRRTARDTPTDKIPMRRAGSAPETVQTRIGTFEFKNRYPTAGATDRLYQLRLFNGAVDAYLASIPAVSMFHMRNGMTEVGVDATAEFLISRPCSTPEACS